jgi:hypothetical protein
MKALLFACFLLVSTTVSVNADVPKPKPPAKPLRALHTRLEIVPDEKIYEAKLQISESELKSFMAAINATPPGNGEGIMAVAGGVSASAMRTIIAGMLMFLAVAVAGVMFARSSSLGRTQKALGAVVLVAVVLGAAAIISRANAGPPGSYYWRNLPKALADGKSTQGGVDIEIVPDEEVGKPVRLLIPLKKGNHSGDE